MSSAVQQVSNIYSFFFLQIISKRKTKLFPETYHAAASATNKEFNNPYGTIGDLRCNRSKTNSWRKASKIEEENSWNNFFHVRKCIRPI